MKICIVSTSALPAPPPQYGGLEAIAYNSASELAKLGNEVTLITTNESTKLGLQQAIEPIEGKVIGSLNVIAAGPTAWTGTGERDMFLNYSPYLAKEFGDGQGVVIDHSWFGYPYFMLSGGEIVLSGMSGGPKPMQIPAHPKMKMMHVIHGVTGWRRSNGEYVPPPGVKYPRILGVSKTHAQYLSNCFKLPVRHVFNGVDVPDGMSVAGAGNGEERVPYLLSLNRILQEKGIHNVIDIALATNTPLKLVGDDEHVIDHNYTWNIMERCARSGGLIEYVGLVDNEKKWEYIRNCKALIACPDPTSYVESFYMGAVEGWMCGKPILALANGGLADTVVSGVNGFLCANPEEMKDVLINGKEVFVMDPPYQEEEHTNPPEIGLYYRKKKVKLEDLDPEKIKQEARKYSIEKMAQGYLDLCKGAMEDDPAYLW